MTRSNPTQPMVVFAAFELDDLAGVQAWVAAMAEDYVLKPILLLNIDGKSKIWCLGESPGYAVAQERVVGRVREELGIRNPASSVMPLPGFMPPPPGMPRLAR